MRGKCIVRQRATCVSFPQAVGIGQGAVEVLNNPPFRADHCGSLLRPEALVAARKQFREKQISAKNLRDAEDAAIRNVVALQERIGLPVVTDGEFRRQNYIIDFYFKIFGRAGIAFEPGPFFHRNAAGEKLPAERMVLKERARPWAPIFVDHFAFLRAVTTRTPKVTLPSPVVLHFLGGDDAILRAAYASRDEYWGDIIGIYRQEIAALHAAGCRYVQIDETSLVKFGDPEIRVVFDARGDDWRTLAHAYVEVLNAILADQPPDLRIAIHVCRGNRLGYWQAETGYDFMADAIFRRLNAGLYLLEFDSPRAGTLDALRLMPEGKAAMLGLITTKSAALEDPDILRSRVTEAARHLPMDRLGITPQCGFSGDVRNRTMTIEQQAEKLRLVVDSARSIWGTT